ncbi:ankyrin repeat domain protein [Nitzschia inconspicua]|uniref:Ankyrin repeat domain protein n=1 Tax=Nitzschia inconspicua TaxID=303405 RepID=A0A9K3LT31_9STRA|nr:ankyrin repeat domain protein [Nitzschia inconspicua]KAG7367470.1 ankyrin repeat domain protein [Nitzschia inconspicua]
MAPIQKLVIHSEMEQTSEIQPKKASGGFIPRSYQMPLTGDHRGDDDSSYSESTYDSDDSGEFDDESVTLQDLLAKELFGKEHCLYNPSRAAKRGYGTLEKVKSPVSLSKTFPKVSSSSDLIAAEMMSTKEAHASFGRFLARMSRSMENLVIDAGFPKSGAKAAEDLSSDTPVTKPEDYLKSLFAKRGIEYKTVSGPTLFTEGFFLEMKHKNYADYTNEVAFAARRGDMDSLKAHVASGKTAQCCNRHKESIIHTICRKGHFDMLQYVIQEAGVSIRICCDQYRTPLHDAAWTHEPNFKMIKMIIDACPDLLYVEDSRGHTPLAYVASPQHEQWCNFLKENLDCIYPTAI